MFNPTLPEYLASPSVQPDNDPVLDAVAIEEGIKKYYNCCLPRHFITFAALKKAD